MSLIPEYVIQKVLVRGLRLLRQDPRIVDVLFRGLQQDELNDLRIFFRDTPIDLAINYPDQDLKLPAIVLLLKGENESQAFLGNLLQSSTSVLETGHPLLRPTTDGVGSAGSVFGGPRSLTEEIQVVDGDTSEVHLAPNAIGLYDRFEEETWVVVTSGEGIGQRRQVLSIEPGSPEHNLSTIITVTPAWEDVPDATSKIKFQTPGIPEGVGEPSKVFSTDDLVSRHGSIYKANYQLLVLGPNPETAIYLYTAVKGTMFANEHFLIREGFMNLTMSGSDFLPRTEYYPDMAYQRAMTVEFDYSFDLYLPNEIAEALVYSQDMGGGVVDQTRLLDKLKVSLTVHDPDVGNVNDPERIVSETTLDLV